MTDKQVLEYIDLINRKLQILTNSGVNWKPEYAEEMKQIDARIAKLYPLVEELRKEKRPDRRQAKSGHKQINTAVLYSGKDENTMIKCKNNVFSCKGSHPKLKRS